MKCNPGRWLWGLLPIAILTLITVLAEEERIESDLRRRAEQALAERSLGWAQPRFIGRDGVLAGRSPDDKEAGAALDTMRKIWGVRTVEDRTGLIDQVSTYVWSASLRGNRVKISGFVPNEATQLAIVGVANAAFPGQKIDDRMKLARGGPARDTWLGGVSFALKQLSSLKHGSAYLNGADLSVAGEAESPAAFKSVKSALENSVPPGIKIVSDTVTAPVASPYLWEALYTRGQLVLSGYVPSEAVRRKLFDAIKEGFPTAAIVDHMDVAAGSPRGWQDATATVIKELGRLREGQARIRDREVTVSGLATDEAAATAVRAAMEKELPRRFVAKATIRALNPGPASAARFFTSIDAEQPVVRIEGNTPTAAAGSTLAALAGKAFPGREIRNDATPADGAIEGWNSCIGAAIWALGRLGGKGRAVLDSGHLEVSGTTNDNAVAEALPRELQTRADGACQADVRVALATPPEPDLVWRAVRSEGAELKLVGEVPDAETKSGLASAAKALFPGATVDDRTRVISATSRKWSSVARAGLRSLAKLRQGEARLAGLVLTVEGVAANEAQAAAAKEQLALDTGQVFTARARIEVKSDATLADEKRQRKADEDRAAAEAARGEAERQSAATQAARREEQRRREADTCQRNMRTITEERTIRFETASAKLSERSVPTLAKLASIAKECPEARIAIAGHTDSDGSAESNLVLSEQRAQAVVTWLTGAGVDAKRLSAVGRGESDPIAPNDTPENRAKNRRIDFTVIMQ